MKYLKIIAGALMLLLLALCNSGAYAQEQDESGVVSYEILYRSLAVEPADTGSIVFESREVAQELPDYSRVWLDGQVSFVGGELSTSERQYQYALANNMLFLANVETYQRAIADGTLVRLQHPQLNVAARRP